MAEGRPLETYLTLVLADQNPELAAAHDELYPERVEEGIPLSITVLYPFAAPSGIDDFRATLSEFFGSHEPLDLELAGLAQWESGAVYAVPEPEQPLRGLLRELWRLFPQFPPYGEVGGDPPPHASLTWKGGDDHAAKLDRVERRLDGILPARFQISEVALMEETEPDRWRVSEMFRLGTKL